jgi:hypothetical protein
MVLADSHRVPRVPWYLGDYSRKSKRFHIRGFYPLWPNFPDRSAIDLICNFPSSVRGTPNRSHNTNHATLARLTHDRFRLIPFRSPLLWESRLFSIPGGTEMVHFPPFAPTFLLIQKGVTGHDSCRVSPFGHPRLKHAAAHRGLSQLAAPFIAFQRQGIHHTPLLA